MIVGALIGCAPVAALWAYSELRWPQFPTNWRVLGSYFTVGAIAGALIGNFVG